MIEIAILYICTGRYRIFWSGFHEACERFFIPSARKKYFVFSDAPSVLRRRSERVETIYQKQLGWPFDTLMRFDMFERILPSIASAQYVFFVNANMRPVETIDETVLPGAEHGGLLVTLHPGFYDKTDPNVFTYERNPASRAYIPLGKGKHYFMGGFSGGTTEAYSQLIMDLNSATKKDLGEGVVALWHDESHLNRYMLERTPKILDPSFGYPEGSGLPFAPKMVILNKRNFGGHSYLRGQFPFPRNKLPGRLLAKAVDLARRFQDRGTPKTSDSAR